jgi:D-glycero-D-manno-heptose 1,7-bisphosphate phosphatase
MLKVIFLDRDGVVNDNSDYYVYKWDSFKINEGLIEALTLLKNNGFDFIIISNQSGIAKNIYSINDVEVLHKKLDSYFKTFNIKILEYYYCYHHPDVTLCLCRKPSPLLFEKSIARFNIDAKKSYMIGDQQRDIEAAEKAGIKGILIKSNSDLRNVVLDIISK